MRRGAQIGGETGLARGRVKLRRGPEEFVGDVAVIIAAAAGELPQIEKLGIAPGRHVDQLSFKTVRLEAG